jgi:hypothetical protein
MDADGDRSDSDSYVSDAASYATVDCCEDDYDYKDSCSISEEEDAEEIFKNGLATWAIEANIARCHVNSLLKLLKTDGGLGYLPVDWRTLAKTQLPRGKLPFRDVPPGRYVHLGLANGIILSLLKTDVAHLPDVIEIIISVDGLPVAKSSGSQFWPILARTCGEDGGFVFVIGIYHGYRKPENVNIFLIDLIREAEDLISNGICVEGKKIRISIVGLVCDAPARCFMTSVVLHNSYESCHKCVTVGSWVRSASGKGGRVTYPATSAPLRTDDSFRRRLFKNHHDSNKERSSIEQILRDMVKNVPLDYMHLTCLGAMKKLMKAWVKGGYERTKLSKLLVDHLSAFLIAMARFIPCDFPRKTRTLNDLPHMKATEYRLHMNYVAPVIFKVLDPQLYNHFILFHVAMKILVNDEDCITYAQYAETLLKTFVKDAVTLYGPKFIAYNIHNLIHLPGDVVNYGPLDNFSSFPFENKLQKMKNLVRRGGKPLEQIVRRMREVDVHHTRVKGSTVVNTLTFLSCYHNSGPLINGYRMVDQYEKMQYCRWTITIKVPDNCVFTYDRKVLLIENILQNSNSEVFILAKQYQNYQNLYEYPLPSMAINEFVVSDLSQDLQIWPISCIVNKCLRIPVKHPPDNTFFVCPLFAHE